MFISQDLSFYLEQKIVKHRKWLSNWKGLKHFLEISLLLCVNHNICSWYFRKLPKKFETIGWQWLTLPWRDGKGEGKVWTLKFIWTTRSCAALRAADLDWIVGPEYSLGGYIFGDHNWPLGKVIIFRLTRGVTTDCWAKWSFFVSHAGSHLTF